MTEALSPQADTSTGLGLPHYPSEAVGIDRVLEYNYWNTNGVGIVIVALEGHVSDWAAYIGAISGYHTEEEAIAWTARHGAKLASVQAARWFPGLPAEAYRS